ncbi:helix-turn-helix transcriptional regulator [Massilia arenae]|uniref:Helix-turn-helix domain-containing protein n=1 Tax=Massilia arenae TaxID=2603288 RepID=A0A5C7G388_9BURK|nr:helix-turn-helix domain-containing protein [Massilia arenae]TXF99276.1 helix-turn-helix domain-containing protein [Massilia arenae]
MLLCWKHNKICLTLQETCDEMGIKLGTAYNMISRGNFPLPIRKQGRQIIVDVRDLGEYFDRQRDVARETFGS